MKSLSVILMVILFSAAVNAQDIRLKLNNENEQTESIDLNLSPGDESGITQPYKSFITYVGVVLYVPMI